MKTLSNMGTRVYCMVAAKRQKGATIIEYVLLAALIAVVSIIVLGTLGTGIANKFKTICESITGGTCAIS